MLTFVIRSKPSGAYSQDLMQERDIMFTEEKLVGISPLFKGKMGIDATWKKGYPAPLVMTDEIIKK